MPTAQEYARAAQTMAHHAYSRGWAHGALTGLLAGGSIVFLILWILN